MVGLFPFPPTIISKTYIFLLIADFAVSEFYKFPGSKLSSYSDGAAAVDTTGFAV